MPPTTRSNPVVAARGRTLLLLLPLLAWASAAATPAAPRSRWLAAVRGGGGQAGTPSSTRTSHGDGNHPVLSSDDFELVGETDQFRGKWRSLLKRDVRYPDGKRVAFDVMDQPGSSVMVFIYNSTDGTTTLIEEYAPGNLDVICGPVAGGCEPDKHVDAAEAARHELEEEAHLVGGTWHSLLDAEGTTAIADKYSTCPFYFYLVVDPELEPAPKPHDHEELLVVHRGVSLAETRRLIRGGRMTVPAACTCLLALEKLRDLGLIDGSGNPVLRKREDGESHGRRGRSSGHPQGEMEAYEPGQQQQEGEEDDDGGAFFPSERSSFGG